MPNKPCDAKKFYDTEFEATISAAKSSHAFGAELVPYKCGTHWHIANKDRKLRSRQRTFNRTYCKACDSYMRAARWQTHLMRIGHQRNVHKQEEAVDASS